MPAAPVAAVDPKGVLSCSVLAAESDSVEEACWYLRRGGRGMAPKKPGTVRVLQAVPSPVAALAPKRKEHGKIQTTEMEPACVIPAT